jgi:SsrA-binding protein
MPIKVISTNRKAFRDYDIIERYDAGIELKGTEVKSLRSRTPAIEESFGRPEDGEVILYNMHIPEFEKSSYFRPDPRRNRRLLLHKSEIKRLNALVAHKGLTIIPLKVYFDERGLVKMEIAAAKGRNLVDKRRTIKEKLARQEVDRQMARFRKRA